MKTQYYEYFNAEGSHYAYVNREDLPDGQKRISLSHRVKGKIIYGLPKSTQKRPLYNILELLAFPDKPVMVFEGEKTVEFSKKLLPDYVCVTAMAGSHSPHLSDWSVLTGRDIVLCPDCDEPGKKWLESLHNLLKGAQSLKWLDLTSLATFPGFDFADLPSDWTAEKVTKELLSTVRSLDEKVILPTFYTITNEGLFFKEELVCLPFEIMCSVSDPKGNGSGILIEFVNPFLKNKYRVVVEDKVLVSKEKSASLIEYLCEKGLKIKNKKRFLDFFLFVKVPLYKVICPYLGWTTDKFEAFSLSSTIVATKELSSLFVSLYGEEEAAQKGTLEDWKNNVASLAHGNSKVMVALIASFSPPFLKILKKDSFWLHFQGHSTAGKTTILKASSSVWGDPDKLVRSARSTDNAMEGAAQMHNNALWCIDEYDQLKDTDVGQLVYMISQNVGKLRMTAQSKLKESYEWCLGLMSSGEIGLEDKLKKAKIPIRSGMKVRMLPLSTGKTGMFENFHHHESAKEFAIALLKNSQTYYGTAIKKFLESFFDNRKEFMEVLQNSSVDWLIDSLSHKNVDWHHLTPQAQRVGDLFCFFKKINSLLIRHRIVPWTYQEGEDSLITTYCQILENLNIGKLGGEITEALYKIQAFIHRYQDRFYDLADRSFIPRSPIAGVKRKDFRDEEFCFFTSELKEILQTKDIKVILDHLVTLKVVVPGQNSVEQTISHHKNGTNGFIVAQALSRFVVISVSNLNRCLDEQS